MARHALGVDIRMVAMGPTLTPDHCLMSFIHHRHTITIMAGKRYELDKGNLNDLANCLNFL